MYEPRSGLYVERWQPAPIWLAAGLVLGPAWGGVAGAALALPGSSGSYADALLFGSSLGGLFGGVVGVILGFLMTLAVGRHLSLQQARERAFLLTFWSAGLFTFPLFTILFAFHPIGVIGGFLVPLAAGALSYWLASYIQTSR